jgi:Heterokaryon incompatibility protein (HET)
MRLIHTETLKFHEFLDSEIPKYAILSHTWGKEEVTFEDTSSPLASFQWKTGYIKIKNTCRMALENRLKYVWIDTCCINKGSSAELTESINSMFRWYKNAEVCYVHLEDLSLLDLQNNRLPSCRWFTRGWTLQELLAPSIIQFYDRDWNYLGSKSDFMSVISRTTGIPISILKGQIKLEKCSIATRMSWAAHRQTSRIEDTAYCLLGIFDVNMPLIYGEGIKAFRRLQEEIMKINNDMTIFAWKKLESQTQQDLSLFAISPKAFADSSDIVSFDNSHLNFSITNVGLRVPEGVTLRISDTFATASFENYDRRGHLILLGYVGSDKNYGIYVRKVGPGFFCREDSSLTLLTHAEVTQFRVLEVDSYHIIINQAIPSSLSAYSRFRNGSIHVPFHDKFTLIDWKPYTLWDISDRVFLRPQPHDWVQYDMVLAMAFRCSLLKTLVVVLCDYRGPFPKAKLLDYAEYRSVANMIFHGDPSKYLYWAELGHYEPKIASLVESTSIKGFRTTFQVTASFHKGTVASVKSTEDLFSLRLNTYPVN